MAMGLHDDATLNISTGHVHLAPVGTPYPADPTNPGGAWVEVGHTSASEIVSIKSTGGDKTTLATLQSKALRESISPKVTTYGFQLGQFDLASLQLYYGTTGTVDGSGLAAGLLGIPDDATPAEKALLIVVIDPSSGNFGWYAPRASIVGGDDISLADSTALSFLPIQVTPLNYLTYKRVYALPIAVDAPVVPVTDTPVSPTSGAAGTVVTITGTFAEVTGVKFGTTNAGMFVKVSATEVRATVPTGISTGSQAITVINTVGASTPARAFTVS